MTVIEKDQHSVCLYRHSINWRDELLQLSVTVEVIVADRSRGIEPVAVSAVESKVANG